VRGIEKAHFGACGSRRYGTFYGTVVNSMTFSVKFFGDKGPLKTIQWYSTPTQMKTRCEEMLLPTVKPADLHNLGES